MATTQSIENFYSVAQSSDFARQFQFRIIGGTGTFAGWNEDHFIYVETAVLPGRQITNVPVPYMGLDFNVPGTVKYPGSAAYNVVFRCDQNYNIRKALEAATFVTFDEATSTGDYNTPKKANTLTLGLLGKSGTEAGINIVRKYKLFGVYVQSLADANYDIKDSGTVQTVNTTLAYQYWRPLAGTGSAPVTKFSVSGSQIGKKMIGRDKPKDEK